MIIISDTSILSGLSSIGHLEILPKLFGEVIITDEILAECLHPLAPFDLRQSLQTHPHWLVVKRCETSFQQETASLDRGEASAITLASTLDNCLLLIDERAGRRIAAGLGIRISGLVGILGKAAQQEHLDFDSAIRLLKKTGFRVSESVIRSVRKHLLELTYLGHLPSGLKDYLSSKSPRVISMNEGEVRVAEFLPLGKLELEWFDVEEDECDGAGNSKTAHFLGFSLLKSADAYHPWGVFLWLPQFQQFGSWDQDHHKMISYPDITWSQIIEDPTWFINGQWYPDKIPHRTITPHDFPV